MSDSTLQAIVDYIKENGLEYVCERGRDCDDADCHDWHGDIIGPLLKRRGKETPENKHVCGLSGYNGMIDPPCPGCVERDLHLRAGVDIDA